MTTLTITETNDGIDLERLRMTVGDVSPEVINQIIVLLNTPPPKQRKRRKDAGKERTP